MATGTQVDFDNDQSRYINKQNAIQAMRGRNGNMRPKQLFDLKHAIDTLKSRSTSEDYGPIPVL